MDEDFYTDLQDEHTDELNETSYLKRICIPKSKLHKFACGVLIFICLMFSVMMIYFGAEGYFDKIDRHIITNNGTATEPNTGAVFDMQILVDSNNGVKYVQHLIGLGLYTRKLPIPPHPTIKVYAFGYYVDLEDGKKLLKKFKNMKIDDIDKEELRNLLVTQNRYSNGDVIDSSIRCVQAQTSPSTFQLDGWSSELKDAMKSCSTCDNNSGVEITKQLKIFKEWFHEGFHAKDDYMFNWITKLKRFSKDDDKVRCTRNGKVQDDLGGTLLAYAIFENSLLQVKTISFNLLDTLWK